MFDHAIIMHIQVYLRRGFEGGEGSSIAMEYILLLGLKKIYR